MIIDNALQHHLLELELKNNGDIILIPIFSDIHLHPQNNSRCALYVHSMISGAEYFILINHNEKLYDVNIDELFHDFTGNIFTSDKKRLLHFINISKIFDTTLLSYLNHTLVNIDIDTEAHKFYKRYYYNEYDINQVLPVVKHIERCTTETQNIIEIIAANSDYLDDITFKIYNEVIVHNYFNIEKQGLFVDKILLSTHFADKARYHLRSGNLIYTDYNLYTRTGRPSNSFAGINFAALTKDDGSREMIHSRFKDGILVEFDFDGYHLRLLADLIGFNFPANCTVHEYLGKQYFGKEELTLEEYNTSKNISFQLLYGGISEEFEQIPFFKMLKDHIYTIWEQFNTVGYVESRLFKRRIKKEFFTDNNKYKLLNYIIQLHETENNAVLLHALFSKLDQFKSMLVLTTYDSFLFDVDSNDGVQFIDAVKEILQDNGKYPVKVSYGNNYHVMKKIRS